MALDRKVALTIGLISLGSFMAVPLAVGVVGGLLSGGNSCTAAASVSFTGSNQLTGMSAQEYLNLFSKDDQKKKLQIATQIYAAGMQRTPQETPKAIATAIATGIQESNLTNVETKASDGSDSVGVFQMRPSQGWGTRAEILNVTYAANKWFDTLHKNVKGNLDSLSMITIAIDVENPNLAAYQKRWNWDKTGTELLSQVAAPGATNSCQSTGWQLPLAAGTYRINDIFGMRINPVTLRYKLHDGVDLGAAKNTPIYAVRSGTVTFAGDNGTYGTYVGMDAGNNVTIGYAHMSSIAAGLKKGDTVTAGQVIGYVGSTGVSTGNHLHLLVHLNGKPADPIAFLNSNGVSLEGSKR
ncbi:MAG: M23 family metallopeptidase [Candidatus Microsaccharimonas sossegonensis]|uniref:M23 family metallopeptidase n=1 Tax=Candidatus Microsaccharimonas sossegonensis TaxID=2506948 RepID=A0A4V1J7H7_9BACT|nr:MAG: M23 family metallopeptidase [Candidatus Microsaccharimonas sossegonensis]